jgi:membrane protein
MVLFLRLPEETDFMRNHLIAVRKIIFRSFKKYRSDDPVKLAGTTAFFTIFAVAPILIIITAVTGLIIGEDIMSERIYAELNSLIGEEGADFVATIVENFRGTERNIIGTIIGIIIFLIASTTFFTILQNSLNHIWRVRAKPKSNLLKALKDRLLSFGLIISIGFILLVLLVVDAALSFFRDFLENYFDQFAFVLIRSINIVISIGVLVLVFALIYRFLPDTRMQWKVTWTGAVITSLLFVAGRYVIGLLLGIADIGIMYGAAGSAVVFLLWVFYSAVILFFGAEITQQYAAYYNYDIRPKDYAVEIEISEKAYE